MRPGIVRPNTTSGWKKMLAHAHGAHVDANGDAKKHGDGGADKDAAQALIHVKEKRAVGEQPNRFVHRAGRTR